MSGAESPANWVTSLSCTELGSTFWYLIWIVGLALFHESTMSVVALTVASWNAGLEKVRVIGPVASVFVVEQPASASAVLAATARSVVGGRGPRLTSPSAPTYRARRSGAVSRAGSWMMTRAKKNSFQAEMNENMIVATTPGARSGKIIRHRTTARDAPSVSAASSSSLGMAAM